MATPKLLLADDSVTIQRVIELTFADENVEVVTVGDGRQAIERLEAERPDIVLADIGMPERDGYEVAEFVKSRPELSHIPVLLLTGAFEPIDEARARSVGCDGVLVKPFEPQMVISRVRELLNKVAPSTAAPRAAPAAMPEPPLAAAPPASGKGDALEDYFDRLDAALATMNTAPPPLEVVPREPEPPAPPPAKTARPVESVRSVAAAPAAETAPPEEHTPASSAGAAAPTVSIDASAPSIPLHEAFAALLSAEQGQPVAPVVLSRESVSDEVVEEVVSRVLARMGSDDTRRAVLDSAERLVRDEIERIKKDGK